MENQIYIPKKLKVGYQKRNDTYSKKLAYVIYYDDKNKLRKETSWNGWCDKKMGSDEFDNSPTEGFVLNRNVGGVRNSYGSWSSDIRIEKVRVYDPRGFEFEIDVPNVLAILQECTSTKGKGLEGTYVYGWNGASLVLIPTASEDYKNAVAYTEIQGHSISSKELVVGGSYKTKKLKDIIYLGRFEWFEEKYNRKKRCNEWTCTKKHIFADLNPEHWWDNEEDEDENLTVEDFDTPKEYEQHLKYLEQHKKEMEKQKADAIKNGEDVKFFTFGSASTLAVCNSDTAVSNYAELLDRFAKTKNASMPKELIETKVTPKPEAKENRYGHENKDENLYFLKDKDGSYISLQVRAKSYYDYKTSKYEFKGFELNLYNRFSFDKDGSFKSDYVSYSDRPKNLADRTFTEDEIKNLGLVGLNVKLTNDNVVKLQKYLNEF